MKHKAFTLAEVLITLAIIGVVAAMTIPTLMTSTRGKEYEVGANKALSTISNAMQMRYAMDGISLADFPTYADVQNSHDKHLNEYLTKLPLNSRPGEQPALIGTQFLNSAHRYSFKLKDGMIVLWSCSHANSAATGGNAGDSAFIVIDTNGEKGPTRSNMVEITQEGSFAANTPNGFYFNTPSYNIGLVDKSGTTHGILEGYMTRPTNNDTPDIVVFIIHGHTGAVKAAGQRTRNILATGNALISQ